MTSSPLRQFFPALAGAVLLGLALYKMTSGTPGGTGRPASPPGDCRSGCSHRHYGQMRPPAQEHFHSLRGRRSLEGGESGAA